MIAVKHLNRLVTIFLVETIILIIIASYRLIDTRQCIANLLIFNLFFITLFFQLNGSLNLKIGILAAGNFLGLLWNLFFYYFSLASHNIFNISFDVFFMIVYPVLNLMWMVPFWSLSLSFLPKQGPAKTT